MKRAAEGLLQGTRVEYCHRSVTGASVRVMERDGRAFFGDIAKCKSRWGCPICARSKIEKDQAQLRDAVAINKQRGGETYLLTFTIRHDKSLPVKTAVAGLLLAQNRMKATRAYKAIMRDAGALGTIASREITFGENGPHPHVHMLVLGDVDQLAGLERVRDLWAEAVKRAGLDAVNEHGFDARGGDYAAEYVAKFGKEPSFDTKRSTGQWWNVQKEMTAGHTKQSHRLGGATPFTLLRWYADGDAESGALFVDYFNAMQRRAQLFWSKGLRAKLDLFRLERPKEPAPRAVEVARIGFDDWHAVMRHDGRCAVLVAAEREGRAGVFTLLDRYRSRIRGRWSGNFRTAARAYWGSSQRLGGYFIPEHERAANAIKERAA